MVKAVSIEAMFGQRDVHTFLGVPDCESIDQLSAKAAILGAPVTTPYRSAGAYCKNAPGAIRKAIAPYAANIHHVDFDLGRPIFPDGIVSAVDCGDLAYDNDDFEKNRNDLRGAVGSIIARGGVPVLLGGDDSAPIPLFEAFAGHGEFVILQVDAHIDWRDEVDGERFGLSSNMRRASEMAHISHIIQVGQRAIGSARPSDYQDALDWGVMFHSGHDVARYGVEPVLESVPAGANVIFALDIDGLDPSVVPGVIGRAPGGLSYWQTVELIQGVAKKARLCGFSLVEFMPESDVDGLGALVCARLVANALGMVAAA